jgi:hypothetical protein
VTLYCPSKEALAEDTRGLDHRWLLPVPLAWQEEVMGIDRDLRLLWSQRVGKFGLVYFNGSGLKMPFEDGIMRGWGLVTWFDPGTTPDQMVTKILGMVDRNRFKNHEDAARHVDDGLKAGQERVREEIRARDNAVVDQAMNDAAIRDMQREEQAAKDARHRAHDRSKSGVFVGGGA